MGAWDVSNAEYWPTTAEDVRGFVGSNYCALRYGGKDGMPDDGDIYTMSAHDIIAAIRQWREFILEHEGKPEPDAKRYWADVPPEFNEWWNADKLTQTNPFRKDSPAYWAFEGWCAAVRATAKLCGGTSATNAQLAATSTTEKP